jgi:bacillithiol biosynthesis cysteine-adding enzyme BshC
LKFRFEHIDLKASGHFNDLVLDHMSNEAELRQWWPESVSEDELKQRIESRKSFPDERREALVQVLLEQYQEAGIDMEEEQEARIRSLNDSKCFTVTTGHQLNLATGPLYFIYKIAHTIRLSRTLNERFPDRNFVPVYWMATEDHDLEEIDHFYSRENKIQWNTEQSGAVGRMRIDDTEWIERLIKEWPDSKSANEWLDLLRDSYNEKFSLSQATRRLVHALFSDHGLIILDADHPELKKYFAPLVADEIENSVIEKDLVHFEPLARKYFQQVNPRKLNLFYLDDRGRYRMERAGDKVELIGKGILDRSSLLQELRTHPERFSPNVLFRPLYQETILPNIAYIGGGAEVAYWLELARVFDHWSIPRPLLLLRNSMHIVNSKEKRKADGLSLSATELLMDPEKLFEQKVALQSDLPDQLDEAYSGLTKIFEAVRELANQTDRSFIGAVDAQEAKQLGGYKKLKKRLLKAEKKRNRDLQDRLYILYDQMNAGGRLQERKLNVGSIFAEMGFDWLEPLIEAMPALHSDFLIMMEES